MGIVENSKVSTITHTQNKKKTNNNRNLFVIIAKLIVLFSSGA